MGAMVVESFTELSLARETEVRFVGSNGQNPKVKGSKAYERWNAYASCSSAGEALDKGCTAKDFDWAWRKGYLRVRAREGHWLRAPEGMHDQYLKRCKEAKAKAGKNRARAKVKKEADRDKQASARKKPTAIVKRECEQPADSTSLEKRVARLEKLIQELLQ
mmetsp:Transcript_14626/g.27464  ORF Transcript_14626/g.27464 Transcript_14626/m.27464 type:complete len:162 (-) Transcript_14626:77-562(-)